MPRKKGPKYYAVRIGRVPGVYNSWEECKQQVDGYSKPAFKSFSCQAEAEQFVSSIEQHPEPAQPAKRSAATTVKAYRLRPPPHPPVRKRSSGPLDPALTYRLEFDGGARDNASTSRLAGCGALIAEQDSDTEVGKIALHLGSYTNNQAEYAGLVLGLEAAHCLGVRKIKAFGDSKLVVKQVGGQWQVKEPGLKGLHARAVAAYSCFESITLQHVLREHNKRADALANLAMDGKGWRGIVDAQGEQLADFDTRSILETADARGATADVPRKLGGSPTSRPTKRQRLGGIPKDSAPSASLAQGEPSPPGSRSHHSSPAYFISTWGQGSCSWRKWHIGQNMPMSSHRASSPSSWPAKNSISTIASVTAWHGTAISRWPGLPFVQRCSWPAHSGKQQLPAVRPLPGRASRNIMSLLCLQTCAHLCAGC